MSYKKQLKHFTVSRQIFDAILEERSSRIHKVSNIYEYYYGYPDKNKILYDGIGIIIIQQKSLVRHIPQFEFEAGDGYIQVILHLEELQETSIEPDITGLKAWNTVYKMLKEFYTDQEIKERLEAHQAEYDQNKAQFHFNYPNKIGQLIEHQNCYKYDINGAHCDALCCIFPKAKEKFIELHKQRKQKPEIKKWFNYFVGMLTVKGYRKTYNWIVQRTNSKLMELWDKLGGLVVYGNTDGIILKDPKTTIPHSSALGEFKLEYHGTVYTYAGKNYWIFQYENQGKLETTGSLPVSLRNKVDLPKGQVVSYDRVLKCYGQVKIYEYQNVEVHYEQIGNETILY